MAYEVLAAIIQGACTVLAAGVAVTAATKGLDSWRREAPGRRRVELAEQCLVKVYETRNFVGKFEQSLSSAIRSDTAELPKDGGGLKSYLEYRESKLEQIWLNQDQAQKCITELSAQVELAEIYFGKEVKNAFRAMSSYFEQMQDWSWSYRRLCNDTYSRSQEKDDLCKKVDPDYGTPEWDMLFDLRSDATDKFRQVLGPYLSVEQIQ